MLNRCVCRAAAIRCSRFFIFSLRRVLLLNFDFSKYLINVVLTEYESTNVKALIHVKFGPMTSKKNDIKDMTESLKY